MLFALRANFMNSIKLLGPVEILSFNLIWLAFIVTTKVILPYCKHVISNPNIFLPQTRGQGVCGEKKSAHTQVFMDSSEITAWIWTSIMAKSLHGDLPNRTYALSSISNALTLLNTTVQMCNHHTSGPLIKLWRITLRRNRLPHFFCMGCRL